MGILKKLAAKVLAKELAAHQVQQVNLSLQLSENLLTRRQALASAKEWHDKALVYKAQVALVNEQPTPPPRLLAEFNADRVTVGDLRRQFYGGLFAIPGLELIELKAQKTCNTYLIKIPSSVLTREFFVEENLHPDHKGQRLYITEVTQHAIQP